MSDDDNVTKLPIKFKHQPSDTDPMLKLVEKTYGIDGCDHVHRPWNQRGKRISYLIREGETEVECSGCGVRLDPMFVLKQMAHAETQWLRTRALYQEEMKRLDERKRTKCDHCGKMTRISR